MTVRGVRPRGDYRKREPARGVCEPPRFAESRAASCFVFGRGGRPSQGCHTHPRHETGSRVTVAAGTEVPHWWDQPTNHINLI